MNQALQTPEVPVREHGRGDGLWPPALHAVQEREVDGVRLCVHTGGTGPALLLLHGHPQSHAMWHRVAPVLAQRHTVVMMDLRGYGDSDRPTDDANHATYSKRRMAADALAVMRQLGHTRFDVLAHDRGARVAHRLGMDAPDAVGRLMLLDIAPTLAMYQRTDRVFAQAYWHWFFLIQPPPLPEALVESDPERYLTSLMGARYGGLQVFDPRALAEYVRCAKLPGTAQAMCGDYRASAGIDLQHDQADIDAGLRLTQPLRVLWGAHGAVAASFDVLALWRERATQVSGQAVPSGHYIAEQVPDLLLAECAAFFSE
jgi:haloacetate dehalogenase